MSTLCEACVAKIAITSDALIIILDRRQERLRNCMLGQVRKDRSVSEGTHYRITDVTIGSTESSALGVGIQLGNSLHLRLHGDTTRWRRKF